MSFGKDAEGETLEDIWASIRDAHQKQAVHEAKCDGRYLVIEQRLGFVIYLLSTLAGGFGVAAIAGAVRHWIG